MAPSSLNTPGKLDKVLSAEQSWILCSSFHLTTFYSLFSLCSKYWPLFLLFFYILSPIPYCISRRVVDDTDSASNACKELAIFLTTGIVISAFGLPIVFARAEVVSNLHITFTSWKTVNRKHI